MAARIDPALSTSPEAIVHLGQSLMASGQGAKAATILRQLRAERPGDADLENAIRTILSHRLPAWHSAMLADHDRNDAYDRAIGRAVSASTRVLDIGTGSGLLAMMAARAGAKHVYACELEGALAETATLVVAANGFADQISIFARHSSQLDRERDLDGGADVVVTEIFSDDLLSEGALPTIEHALSRLVRPGARVIPARAAVRVALAFLDRPIRPPPTQVSGFDISAFADHVPPQHPVRVGDRRLHLRGDPEDVFDFKLATGTSFGSEARQVELRSNGGPVNGVVQWIRLQLDEHETYENAPRPGASSAWGLRFIPLPSARVTEPGERLCLHATHHRDVMRLWFDPSG